MYGRCDRFVEWVVKQRRGIQPPKDSCRAIREAGSEERQGTVAVSRLDQLLRLDHIRERGSSSGRREQNYLETWNKGKLVNFTPLVDRNTVLTLRRGNAINDWEVIADAKIMTLVTE